MKALAIAAVVGLIGFGALAQYAPAYSNETAEVTRLRREAAALKKATVVRYRKFDGSYKPCNNVVTKGNVVEISKVFACPKHKGHTYDENGRCSYIMDIEHNWMRHEACDAKADWCAWNEWRSMIGEQEVVQSRLNEIDDRIAEIDATVKMRAEEAARKQIEAKDDGKIVVERDDQLLVRIKVSTLMRVLSGERVSGDTLRIYYQEPDASDDL